MCGIAALLEAAGASCSRGVLERMRDEVAYRGPDDHGRTFFGSAGATCSEVVPSSPAWEVGLGHRRLSILDLSPAGHQPMGYRGKYWTVYNGEVYNYVEIRS